MHLVGLIIRIYHDARSPERQTQKTVKSVQVTPRGVVVNMLGTGWCNGELVCVLVRQLVLGLC